MSTFLNPAFLISILIALSVHEWAHGFAAMKLGDPTAKYEGRLTLNPIAHLDPVGTLMFILVGFGWGKPVPVDPRYFKNVRRDSAIVSLAGPFSNFIIAWIAFFGLLAMSGGNIPGSPIGLLTMRTSSNPFVLVFIQICASSLFINLALMAFNLLPIAPLDGSKVIRPFIPLQYEDIYHEFMRRGPFFLILLLIFESFAGIPLLSGWVFGIIKPILSVMGMVGGIFV